MTAPATAWRIRAVAAGATLALLLGLRLVLPDPGSRLGASVLVAVGLGYGHLLGAALTRHRVPDAGAGTGSGLAWLVPGIGALLALALAGAAGAGWLFAALLAVTTWHTVENDLALSDRRHRTDEPPAPGPALLPPLSRRVPDHATAVGLSALLLALLAAGGTPLERLLASGAPAGAVAGLGPPARTAAAACGVALLVTARSRGRRAAGAALIATAVALPVAPSAVPEPLVSLTWVELFAAPTLYHVFTWIALLARRAVASRRGPPRRRALARLAALHLVPLAACAALALGAPRGGLLAPLAAALLSPTVYLAWAALHVASTTAPRLRPAYGVSCTSST